MDSLGAKRKKQRREKSTLINHALDASLHIAEYRLLYILLWSCLVKGKRLIFAVFLCHHLQQTPVVLLIILLYGLKIERRLHRT